MSAGPAQTAAAERHFLTGGTGFIGGHLLLGLLRQGAQVCALARGEDPEQRVRTAVLRAAAYAPGPAPDERFDQLRVLAGDLRLPGCGVEPAADAAGGTFWHLAANLRYHERHRAPVFEDNVSGTREAVRLAALFGYTRFVYVSTAYTAARQAGRIPEVLHDQAGPFNNVYEESKCAAEHAVVEGCEAAGLEWVIARPSVVIGLSGTWSSGGSDSGLYGFAHRIKALRQPLTSHGPGIRISATADMPLNLVAVDWVVADLLAIGRDRHAHATIRHLSSDSSVSVQDVLAFITSSLGVPPLVTVQGEVPQPTTIERQLARQTQFYSNYLHYPKTFDRSMPPSRSIEPHEVKAAVDSFMEELAADPARKPAIW